MRFAKDKSPYKTNLGAGFPWVEDGAATWARCTPAAASAATSTSSPANMFIGGGTWQPQTATLAAWRQLVVDRNDDVHEALGDPGFVKTFKKLSGEQFKRVPAGVPADHPDAELLKLKQLLFGRSLSDREVSSPKLPDVITEAFAAAMPVMRLPRASPA